MLEGLDGTQSDYNHQQKQDTRCLPLGGGERNGYAASGTFEGGKRRFRERAPWDFFFFLPSGSPALAESLEVRPCV